MLEKLDFQNKKVEMKESQLARILARFLRNKITMSAIALTTLMTLQSCDNDYTSEGSFNNAYKKAKNNKEETFTWNGESYSTKFSHVEYRDGVVDFSSDSTFNDAFKRATDLSKEEFMWKGKRYNTELVNKEFSENYWESKNFLTDYYNSDYFKSKFVHSADWLDSADAESITRQKLENNPRWQYLDKKMMSEDSDGGLSNSEFEEYEKLQDIVYSSDFKNSKLYKSVLDSIIEAKSALKENSEKRIEALNEPTYFSITHHKGSLHEDGSYNTKNKNVFIYGGEGKDKETTSVHELTHKSTKGNKTIKLEHWLGLRQKAFKSIKENGLVKKYAQQIIGDYREITQEEYDKLVGDWIDYITNPTEVDARQNSTRFWLYKHFEGYTASTVFTEEHLNFLNKNLKDLPYDIRQLIELFPSKDDFIYNMNTY